MHQSEGSPYGTVSSDSLRKATVGRKVTVTYDKRDRYGRIVGKVLVEGLDVNLQQVETGLAWHYKQYQSEQTRADRYLYAQAELDARIGQLGLWREPNPVAPWDWRRRIREGTFHKPANPITQSRSAKRLCGQMVSCGEVMHYVQRCGSMGLDGDADGVPWKSMCR